MDAFFLGWTRACCHRRPGLAVGCEHAVNKVSPGGGEQVEQQQCWFKFIYLALNNLRTGNITRDVLLKNSGFKQQNFSYM